MKLYKTGGGGVFRRGPPGGGIFNNRISGLGMVRAPARPLAGTGGDALSLLVIGVALGAGVAVGLAVGRRTLAIVRGHG